MPLDKTAVLARLRTFDFPALFTQDLGWDKHSATFDVTFNGQNFVLSAIAEKRGMVALHCPCPVGTRLPDYPTRCKIEQQITRSAHEHLLIFTDPSRSLQIWQWVKREAGKPLARREHHYHTSQSGDSLIQKLQNIAFSLAEEEGLTLVDVTTRAGAGFDIERVTKRFYERFKKEHAVFLEFIEGIGEMADRQWYASLMLNRLMFVYFVQKKGFLDGDLDYLRNRLARTREEHGKDKFYSFYRYFLIRLFHEGLGRKARTPELEKLLGRIPYFNGGMFEPHEIERRFPEIHIPDNAFKRIFDYFDEYQWHLDERPLRDDREINPDVLGYIFEKYINQKEMGAYYTKEDITEYISKNTVLPFLFDAARAKCKVAFDGGAGFQPADSGGVPAARSQAGPAGKMPAPTTARDACPTVWDLLKTDPDRYIYPAVRHGLTWSYVPDHPAKGEPLAKPLELPAEIAAGLGTEKPGLIERRHAWNQQAPSEYALPTEIWREVVGRWQRYAEIRQKLAAGEVRDVNDLVTLNLDIRQFAQDVIQNCEGPDLLRALWHAIEKITILDPTCGSGAFLFAALNILEPLYEACLERMESFLEDESRKLGAADLRQTPHGYPLLPKGKFEDFSKLLDRVADHPSRRYFTLKSIILNNLFGVDIMEEATEICKLRLFLKLAAQVEPDPAKENFGVEPLPDIDFNIRAGNTLVGYATADEVRRCMKELGGGQMKLMGDEELGSFARFNTRCADVEQAFAKFRQLQTEGDGSVPQADKLELQKRLRALEEELDRYLAGEYGLTVSDRVAYARWVKSHQPFHWFIQFYGILARGGFDVIIGNPPYVETSKVNHYRVTNYKTIDSGNLYPLCLERSGALLYGAGYMGVIVPLSGFSTDRMLTYQEFIWGRFNSLALSFYSGDAHPSVLFDGVKYRLCIIIATTAKGSGRDVRASDYLRWYACERPDLFASKVAHARSPFQSGFLRFAKTGTRLADQVILKLLAQKPALAAYLRDAGKGHITYHRSPVFWIRSMDFEPYFKSPVKDRSTDHLRDLYFADADQAKRTGAILNSSLFYFWFTVQGNCRNIAGPDIESFPVGDLASPKLKGLIETFAELMADLRRHSKRRVYVYEAAGKVEYDEFYPDRSKPIIDEIDKLLARHYAFTEEELDFVLNYHIKYRLGRDAEEEDAE
jgi:hypothetical protein